MIDLRTVKEIKNSANKVVALIEDSLGNVIYRKSRLPSGYQELDYIQSTGTQWIDTGVKGNNNIGFDVKFYSYDRLGQYEYGTIFAARHTSRNRDIALTTYGSNNGTGTLRWSTGSFDAGITNNAIVTASLKNKIYTGYDGTTIDLSSYDTFETPNNIAIFALNQRGTISQYGKLRLYYLKFYDGNTLTREFIPCYRKSDGEAGLYDLVTKTFFVNQGTGAFIKGNSVLVPSEYQQVEYIENTDSQYIDTGYVPNDTSGIKIVISTAISGNNVIVGARRNASTDTRWIIGVNYSGSPQRNNVYGGWNSNDATADRPTFDLNIPFEYQMNYLNNRKRIFNGIEKTPIEETLTTIEYPAYLFCYNAGGSITTIANKRIYYVEFTEGSNVVRKLIPCYRKADGEIGMYDLINGVFYTNVGTGTFIKGADVLAA